MVRSAVNVAGVTDGNASLAAAVVGVGARSFVLAPSALRLVVAQQVLPEVRPVSHGTVPRVVQKLLGQRCVFVEGESQSESSSETQTSSAFRQVQGEAWNFVDGRRAKVITFCPRWPVKEKFSAQTFKLDIQPRERGMT